MTMYLPLLDMVSTEVTITSSALATKISRSIKTITNTFANDGHCMSVAANILCITLAPIVDTLNCSWSNEGLDEKIGSTNKHLRVIKLCGPPTGLTDQLCYSNISRSVATAQREHEINKDILHFKPKTT